MCSCWRHILHADLWLTVSAHIWGETVGSSSLEMCLLSMKWSPSPSLALSLVLFLCVLGGKRNATNLNPHRVLTDTPTTHAVHPHHLHHLCRGTPEACWNGCPSAGLHPHLCLVSAPFLLCVSIMPCIWLRVWLAGGASPLFGTAVKSTA